MSWNVPLYTIWHQCCLPGLQSASFSESSMMVTVTLPLDLEVTLPLRELLLTVQTKVSSPSQSLSSTMGKVNLCVFLVRVNDTEMELVSKSSPSVAETPEHLTRTVNCLRTFPETLICKSTLPVCSWTVTEVRWKKMVTDRLVEKWQDYNEDVDFCKQVQYRTHICYQVTIVWIKWYVLCSLMFANTLHTHCWICIL